MTIRRQYSLPNCTLILDGLSDGTPTTGSSDSRPVMSSLYNAECHFVGCEQPLFGGRDFLTSLVETVSSYTQELLSGVPHPVATNKSTSLISLNKGHVDGTHTLNTHPDPNTKETGFTGLLTNGQPTQIELSTVQLFDLVEAIDKFLADERTLPDLKVPLKPVTKALVQPISSQATSIGLGFTSLFVAAIIGYALPSPKVSAPKFVDPIAPIAASKKPEATPTPTPTASPAAKTTPPSPTPSASASPSPTAKIIDATQLGFLDRKLRRDLNQNWQERGQIKQSGSFRVSVNKDGDIVGYEPTDRTNDPKLAELTPLPKLAKPNPDPTGARGDFRVVFTPSGVLEVSPWDGRKRNISLGKEIVDLEVEKTLATQLQSKLEQELASEKPQYEQDIKYRVGVTKTGEIVDYEHTDASSFNAESKTPLPKLVKFNPQAASSDEPVARYIVTFQKDGKVVVGK